VVARPTDLEPAAAPTAAGCAAPGAPGILPTWCSSAKEMVGCSLGASRVWFTIGGGILNEVYYPRVDLPQTRDLGFIVADGRGFWVEVKRLAQHTLSLAADGVPAVSIVHRHERFELTLRIVSCHQRDALLIDVALEGDAGLRPYALLAPHLGGSGHHNTAAVGLRRGRRMLWAKQGPFALALAAVDAQQRDAWGRASAGYVGASDGWQDFAQHGAMSWEYAEAGPGNVALMGELPCRATLALGFSSSRHAAATIAVSALLDPFEHTWQRQIDQWIAWHTRADERRKLQAQLSPVLHRELRTSAMVLRAHQDKTYPGTMVASLSVPWGNTRDEIGGYHLVWPRDLCECAGAMLTLGAVGEARDTLRYLIATQHPDGHWSQNQWLGGRSFWRGLQLDETAFPVLLAAALAERDALDGIQIGDMIGRALAEIVRTGPVTAEDRWEEDAGINAFTLTACIAALVSGAPFLEAGARELALLVADYWNAKLEAWTCAHGTPLAAEYGVEAYYVRVAPPDILSDSRALEQVLPVRNWRADPNMRAWQQVGVDFLQLVRFGLRAADDPLVLSTLKVIDAQLRIELPTGPGWYRYSADGYGEHDDGSAYDGTGRGRPWPLLTGERGHYELVAGRDPLPQLAAMAQMASSGGMIPEQVWDTASLPALGLDRGHATGSAMPLAWAHAEFMKLAASRELGRPSDRPAAVWQRYQGKRPQLKHVLWTPAAAVREMPRGVRLTLGLRSPSDVLWSIDGWRTVRTQKTRDSGLQMHVLEIDANALAPGAHLEFTYRAQNSGAWAGQNFAVEVRADT